MPHENTFGDCLALGAPTVDTTFDIVGAVRTAPLRARRRDPRVVHGLT